MVVTGPPNGSVLFCTLSSVVCNTRGPKTVENYCEDTTTVYKRAEGDEVLHTPRVKKHQHIITQRWGGATWAESTLASPVLQGLIHAPQLWVNNRYWGICWGSGNCAPSGVQGQSFAPAFQKLKVSCCFLLAIFVFTQRYWGNTACVFYVH